MYIFKCLRHSNPAVCSRNVYSYYRQPKGIHGNVFAMLSKINVFGTSRCLLPGVNRRLNSLPPHVSLTFLVTVMKKKYTVFTVRFVN